MDLSLQTFHPFARLPRELRLEIWIHAILVPRNVQLQINQVPREQLFYTPTPNPRVLLTNHESRAEGLTVYNPGFSSDVEVRKIYINFEMDTIESHSDCFGWLTFEERRCLRKLRLNIGDDDYVSEAVLVDGIMEMSALREFNIVLHDVGDLVISYAYDYSNLKGIRKMFEQRFQHLVDWNVLR